MIAFSGNRPSSMAFNEAFHARPQHIDISVHRPLEPVSGLIIIRKSTLLLLGDKTCAVVRVHLGAHRQFREYLIQVRSEPIPDFSPCSLATAKEDPVMVSTAVSGHPRSRPW